MWSTVKPAARFATASDRARLRESLVSLAAAELECGPDYRRSRKRRG